MLSVAIGLAACTVMQVSYDEGVTWSVYQDNIPIELVTITSIGDLMEGLMVIFNILFSVEIQLFLMMTLYLKETKRIQ